jgi:hypothetical protein
MNWFLILSLLFQEAGTLGRMNVERFTLQETATPEESAHAFWWLNSGGYYFERRGYSQTMHGELPEGDAWRERHNKTNPRDTEEGRRPQNIFRLVGKQQFESITHEIYFNITAYNLTASPERTASNGLLLMSCYQDGDNLYYAGVRVDGRVVIKKKYRGVYYDLVRQSQVYPGEYNKDTNPNLLPIGEWIGVRTEVSVAEEGTTIRLFLGMSGSGTWELVAQTTDDGSIAGLPFQSGRVGIRTDFMDAKFRNHKMSFVAAFP